MTVSELRKALRGLRGDMDVYTRDHDQTWYETNADVRSVEVVSRREMDDYERGQARRDHGDDFDCRKKKYVVVGP